MASRVEEEEEDFAWFQESVQLLVSPCKFTDLAILDDDIHSVIVLDDAAASTGAAATAPDLTPQ